ncbi:hypothetical protein [Paenibacillus qinlingensis]|uniref:Uncharacterized protein n=1 Tax=Paenibacillus qinlingensis TaxID=1837343 RepID=A0ABU1P6T2_9BACL|nr:hypothetical protein [Paenibacillus qinlingensis]MDR6555474.1 hypothetical protein [Paenibacillus qinlingensis]
MDEKLLNVKLDNFDLKRIKEVFASRGNNPDEISELEVWSIISDALIEYKIRHVPKVSK